MPANPPLWTWCAFIAGVLLLLALDLGLLRRRSRVIGFGEAAGWTAVWCSLSLGFGALLVPWRGATEAVEFLTGYTIELSLSMDNMFVIAMIFSAFGTPLAHQHRVLVWGIVGALGMRGAMIGLGAALIGRFGWMLYVFGAFLVFTGIQMMVHQKKDIQPDGNLVIRVLRRVFPVAPAANDGSFWTRIDGRWAVTPLALALVLIETTDLVFALDSIPAIFAVTRKTFIVFTSNVCAILGLRSLYFLLANAIGSFRFLKFGISGILVFIGFRMLLDPHGGGAAESHATSFKPLGIHLEIPTGLSLGIILGILAVSIAASLLCRGKGAKA